MRARGNVHCLLDCLGAILESRDVDSRPLYAGVWDASFQSNEQQIHFYDPSLPDPKEWLARFETLYGASVLYGEYSSGQPLPLKGLVAVSPAGSVLVASVDTHDLPYSINYRSRHAPHFVLLEPAEDGGCRLSDPYFGWEGPVDVRELEEGFEWGIIIDAASIRHPDRGEIRTLLEQDQRHPPNRLLQEVERIVRLSLESTGGRATSELFDNIQEAGVIAKRYGGFEYVLRYFADRGVEIGHALDAVRSLQKGWENFLLAVIRMGIQGQAVDWAGFEPRFARLRELESAARDAYAQALTDWLDASSDILTERGASG